MTKERQNYSRRTWMRQSFLATTGLAFLSDRIHTKLLASQEGLAGMKDRDEKFWRLVQKTFQFESGLRYFNNASLGPSPDLVVGATNEFRRQLDAFPSKYMWYEWKDEKEEVRKKMAAMLGVDPEEIALTHNTTEGMNLVASSLELEAGDEVILSDHEHHTGTIPWKYHQERKGVRLVRPKLPLVPNDKSEIIEVYRQALTPRTKVVSMVHMTNTNGMILPVKEISEMCRERGILVAVDGAQSVGMLPFSLHELGCDFFAGSGHKWLFSPKGMGVFYARKASQHLLKPMIVCGGYEDESIRRLENYNTRNLPELLGMGAALDFQDLLGHAHRFDRILALKAHLLQGLKEDDRFLIKTPIGDDFSAGIITVELKGKPVKAIQQSLIEDYRIDCRPMTTHGLNGLRLSLSVFNSKEDIDYLLASLDVLAA